MKAWRHVVVFAGVVLLLLAATARAAPAFAAATPPGSPPDCRRQATPAAGAHQAGLVVTFGDRPSRLICVDFTEDSISGLELIKRSGIPLVLGFGGTAVCAIDGVGSSDPTKCFAPCNGGSCQYWAYYQWSDGAWQYSPLGAAQRIVRDGDIDGWSWQSAATPTATSSPPPASTPEPAATSVSDLTPITTTRTPTPPTASAIRTPTAATVPPATEAPPSSSSAASPVIEAAGVARTRVPSTATASPAAVAPSPSATPRSGAVIVGAREGERNAGRSQRAPTRASTSARKALIGFGGVASALVGLAGFLWYRKRQAVD